MLSIVTNRGNHVVIPQKMVGTVKQGPDSNRYIETLFEFQFRLFFIEIQSNPELYYN
jgi:hypothetical protein